MKTAKQLGIKVGNKYQHFHEGPVEVISIQSYAVTYKNSNGKVNTQHPMYFGMYCKLHSLKPYVPSFGETIWSQNQPRKEDVRTTRNKLSQAMTQRSVELHLSVGRHWTKEQLATDPQWKELNDKLQATFKNKKP